jgi:hypothetical protein
MQNFRVRVVNVSNFGNMSVSSVAGGSPSSYLDNTNPLAARFSSTINGIVVIGPGNLLLADGGNNRVRRISPSGVTTFAGSGTSGTLDGSGTNSRFSSPNGLHVSTGNVFITQSGAASPLRMLTLNSNSSTLLSNSTSGFSDGNGGDAMFSTARGVVTLGNGTIFISDSGNNCIRQVTLGTFVNSTIVSTFAGNRIARSVDGIGTQSGFNAPAYLAIDAVGNLLVAETGAHLIRTISPGGVVSTLAGYTQLAAFQSSTDGIAPYATFTQPTGIAAGVNGTIFVSDAGWHRIRMITPAPPAASPCGAGTFFAAANPSDGTFIFNSFRNFCAFFC